MRRGGVAALRRLEALMRERGLEAAASRAELLESLARPGLPGPSGRRARFLERLHEAALYLAAYPDDARVHAAAEDVLRRLPGLMTRAVSRHLEGTGMAGTSFTYGFDYPVARWLGERVPGDAAIAWDEFEDETALLRLLPLLAGSSEDLGIDDPEVGVREWVDAARGERGDLAWLTGAVAGLGESSRRRDARYDGLGVPVRLALRDARLSRTGARLAGAPVVFHPAPLRRKVDLRTEVFRPIAGRTVSRREARTLIDLALASLVARQREMFPISHASPEDVTVYEPEPGLLVVVYGTLPDRRLPLEALWGYLFVKNGIPIGYGCFSTLFGSSEVAMNVFESFRAGESAVTVAALLRVIRAHSGATSFTALKYQIGGDENEEAIASGAFWFYHKLGFRPIDPGALRLLAREEKRLASRPGYRSSPEVLRKFAEHNVYLCLGTLTTDLLGHVPYGRLGMHVTRLLAKRGDGGVSSRGEVAAVVAAEAARAIGLRWPARGSRGDTWARELLLFVTLINDVKRWSIDEKALLRRVIGFKSGTSERSFCMTMATHTKFKKAILTLAWSESP